MEVASDHRKIIEKFRLEGTLGGLLSNLGLKAGSAMGCIETAQPLRATYSTAWLSLWAKCFSSLVSTCASLLSLSRLPRTAVRSIAPPSQSPLVGTGRTASATEAVSSPAQLPQPLLKRQMLQPPLPWGLSVRSLQFVHVFPVLEDPKLNTVSRYGLTSAM